MTYIRDCPFKTHCGHGTRWRVFRPLPTHGYDCRLADFGLSRILDLNSTHVSTQSIGTVPYMPPELLSTGRMSKAVDVSCSQHGAWACRVPGLRALPGCTTCPARLQHMTPAPCCQGDTCARSCSCSQLCPCFCAGLLVRHPDVGAPIRQQPLQGHGIWPGAPHSLLPELLSCCGHYLAAAWTNSQLITIAMPGIVGSQVSAAFCRNESVL